MGKLLLSVLITSLFALTLTVGMSFAKGPKAPNSNGLGYGYGGVDKVTICHIPPGNPSNAHTIIVGSNAVGSHLGHGDTMGPCPGPTP